MNKWLRLGTALALGASSGWTVDWQARYPKPEGYVSDFAHVIDAAARKQIEAYAASVEHATGAPMMFATIPSIEGEPVESIAGAIFRGWGTGDKGDDNGVLVLFAVAEHRFHLEEGSRLVAILPAGLVDRVLDEMRPALLRDDPGDAMAAAAVAVGSAIARAKHVHLTASLPGRRHLPAFSDRWNWMVLAGVIALLLLFSRAPGPRAATGVLGVLPWLVAGNRMGGRSSYGCQGGGGFGGYDSGDGFGGFGGADCGKGGTSSDW